MAEIFSNWIINNVLSDNTNENITRKNLIKSQEKNLKRNNNYEKIKLNNNIIMSTEKVENNFKILQELKEELKDLKQNL